MGLPPGRVLHNPARPYSARSDTRPYPRQPPTASRGSIPLPAPLRRAIVPELESRASIRSRPHSLPPAKAGAAAARPAAPATAPSPSSATLCAPAKTGRPDASSARSTAPAINPHGEVAADYTPQPAPVEQPATLRLLPLPPAPQRVRARAADIHNPKPARSGAGLA